VLNTSEATRVGGYKETKCVKYKQGEQVTMVRDQENKGLVALNMSKVSDEPESRDEGEPHMH